MEASDNKKVIEINWVSILLILAASGLAIFFGVKTSRLSAKQERDIAEQAVLKAQRDTAYAKVVLYAERVKVLEADVKEANKNTSDAEKSVTNYRKKYNELKNKPDVPDTIKVVECDELLGRYDNFITVLKSNVASYSRLADTLKLENKYLAESYKLCLTLSDSQAIELTKTRKQLRKSKILNWGAGGMLVGAIVVIIAK